MLMLEGDWVEHWMSGEVGDHGPNEDGYHATVRSHHPLTRPHALPGVRGSNADHLQHV